MEKLRFVGLDVHKDSITIAVADDEGSAPTVVATVPNETTSLLKRLKKAGSRCDSSLLLRSGANVPGVAASTGEVGNLVHRGRALVGAAEERRPRQDR
jgi:hypothetical protein